MRIHEVITESLNKLHNPNEYQQALSTWEDYYGDGEGKQQLDQYSQTVDQLNQRGGTVYRAVWVQPGKKPRLDEPGEHWTISPEQAEQYLESTAGHSAYIDLMDDGIDPVPYIIGATVGPNSITNKNVLIANFPDEFEVGLTNPASAKISVVKQADNPFR